MSILSLPSNAAPLLPTTATSKTPPSSASILRTPQSAHLPFRGSGGGGGGGGDVEGGGGGVGGGSDFGGGGSGHLPPIELGKSAPHGFGRTAAKYSVFDALEWSSTHLVAPTGGPAHYGLEQTRIQT